MLGLRPGYTSAEHGRKRLPLVDDPILGDAAPTLVTLLSFSFWTDRSADRMLGFSQDWS